MRSTRVPLLVALVVLSLCAVPLSAAGGGGAPSATAGGIEGATSPAAVAAGDHAASAGATGTLDRAASTPAIQDRDDDHSTGDTIGYVEGYWYDDELPVDDREDATVDDDELDAVVYRAMARVEVIRERTFEDDVDVEVRSRSAYQAEQDDLFTDLGPAERLQENVNYEALFMIDGETNAVDEAETLYGGAVEGYYEPQSDRIVVVSNTPDEPELNEVVLGHELVHALQDQHFDLTNYDRESLDGSNAENGLIEGDAVAVERAYDQRCGAEWECVLPADGPTELPDDVNWGLYFTIYQPYADGPDYVAHLREQGGWDAVDDAYDDPPASTSEVIHPGEDREPVETDVADRSSEDWEQLEIDGEPATETVGEAGMAAMFADGAIDRDRPSVVSRDEFLGMGLSGGEDLRYDQPYTDGWAGDELVTYVPADADTNGSDDPIAAADDAGYVWQTEWVSEGEAQAFVDGYLQLLEINGASAVADRQDTYEIADGFAGAYYAEQDGETVTIVHAPSIDALDEVEQGAAPEGDDRLEVDEGGDDGADETGSWSDEIPGFGLSIAVLSLVLGTLAVRNGRRR
ncbi:Hvo_1808 family surface protein [Halosolutus amylolyticus]|uniref:Hvo_1808 family surface protein n=1 Tax=Halosolutus amylolyticus TaxID=2932267 RepID=A0ABD5PMP3_9EURY|nr:Hvo_1808 family surface protein [Halosolutus amylolyticus]